MLLGLCVNRLGEQKHVRLRRRVAGVVGQGLKPGRGGHVDYRSAPALDHPREVARHQVDRRLDQQPNLAQLALATGLGERLVDAVSGVVDQDLDLRTQLLDAGGEPVAIRGLRQVGGDHDGALLTAELLGQLGQTILPAGDERHSMTTRGQLARVLLADPRRRSGHERDRLRRRWGKAHLAHAPIAKVGRSQVRRNARFNLPRWA